MWYAPLQLQWNHDDDILPFVPGFRAYTAKATGHAFIPRRVPVLRGLPRREAVLGSFVVRCHCAEHPVGGGSSGESPHRSLVAIRRRIRHGDGLAQHTRMAQSPGSSDQSTGRSRPEKAGGLYHGFRTAPSHSRPPDDMRNGTTNTDSSSRRPDIAGGVLVGTFMALAYSVIAIIIFILGGREAFDSNNTTLSAVLLAYWIGGLSSGLLLGKLMPFTVSKRRAMLVGPVIAAPAAAMLVVTVSGLPWHWSVVEFVTWIIVSTIFGVYGGMVFGGSGHGSEP